MAERADVIRLKDVVAADMAGGWGGNTDAQVQTWLDENTIRKNDVQWDDFMLWLSRYNGINKMEAAKASGTTDLVKSAAASALVGANAGQPLRLSLDEVRGFLNNLIPAFSNETMPRWQFYSVPRSPGAIARARVIS